MGIFAAGLRRRLSGVRRRIVRPQFADPLSDRDQFSRLFFNVDACRAQVSVTKSELCSLFTQLFTDLSRIRMSQLQRSPGWHVRSDAGLLKSLAVNVDRVVRSPRVSISQRYPRLFFKPLRTGIVSLLAANSAASARSPYAHSKESRGSRL